MKQPKWIAVAVGVILVGILVFQNTQVVSIKLYFWDVSMSMALFCPLILAVGAGLGILAYILVMKRRRGAD